MFSKASRILFAVWLVTPLLPAAIVMKKQWNISQQKRMPLQWTNLYLKSSHIHKELQSTAYIIFQGQETNTNTVKGEAYREHSYNYLCQGLACPHNKIIAAYSVSNRGKINNTILTRKTKCKGLQQKITTNLKQALELLLSALVVQPRED